jgi:hypothetical protein
MHTTPQKQLFQTPSEILVHRGVYIKWNGPKRGQPLKRDEAFIF